MAYRQPSGKVSLKRIHRALITTAEVHRLREQYLYLGERKLTRRRIKIHAGSSSPLSKLLAGLFSLSAIPCTQFGIAFSKPTNFRIFPLHFTNRVRRTPFDPSSSPPPPLSSAILLGAQKHARRIFPATPAAAIRREYRFSRRSLTARMETEMQLFGEAERRNCGESLKRHRRCVIRCHDDQLPAS